MAPLISFLCQKYGVLRAIENVKQAQADLGKTRFGHNLEKMQAQLQIDMTRQFIEQQMKMLERQQLHVDDHRMHLENFVQAMIMDTDERERALIASKEGVHDSEIKDIALNYYRCA